MAEAKNPRDQAAKPGDGGRISAIRPENPGGPKGAAIQVDGRLAVLALAKDAEGLAVGDWIQEEQLRRLQARYERGAYLQALRFLGRRDRSAREVQRHLQAKGWDETACARAMGRLEQEGLIGDRALAHRVIDYRARTAPRSRRAMIQELRQRGIARDIVRKAVAGMDERALALACARKRQRHWQRYPADDRLKRVMAFLQRKGFPYAVCREAARILTGGDAPND